MSSLILPASASDSPRMTNGQHAQSLQSPQKPSKVSIVDQLFGSVAVRKLDVDGVRKLCEQCGIPVAGQGNDAILSIAHHVRMKLPDATPAEKSESENWLRFRNLI